VIDLAAFQMVLGVRTGWLMSVDRSRGELKGGRMFARSRRAATLSLVLLSANATGVDWIGTGPFPGYA
jgi:hypothetical protein